MVTDVTISKGAYSVIIYVTEISENLTNKIFPITPIVGKQNQDTGPKDTKVVDLLRNTRGINITRGYIAGTSTKTATEVKADLISIFNGAGVKGGVTSFVYDGNTLSGFIEKITITETASDEPTTLTEDVAKYLVQLNFIVGTMAGG
jgi:hypothetical protein